MQNFFGSISSRVSIGHRRVPCRLDTKLQMLIMLSKNTFFLTKITTHITIYNLSIQSAMRKFRWTLRKKSVQIQKVMSDLELLKTPRTLKLLGDIRNVAGPKNLMKFPKLYVRGKIQLSSEKFPRYQKISGQGPEIKSLSRSRKNCP